MKKDADGYEKRWSVCLSRACALLLMFPVFGMVALAQSPPGDPIPPPTDNPPPSEPCWQRSTTRRLPNLGSSFTYTKSLDCDLNSISAITVDENGNEVDIEDLLKAEEAARQMNPRGKIDRRLRKAAAADPQKFQRVIVWLTFDSGVLGDFATGLLDPIAPPLGEPPSFDEQQVLDIEAQILEFNRARVAIVIDRFRQLLGNRVFGVSTTAPVVGVVAKGQEILALASLPEVDTLYVEESGEDLNRDALFAHRVLPDWENAGFGEGRRIAVLEDEALEDNIFLNVAGYYRPSDLAIDFGHAMEVGGSIGSLLLTRLGTAPLAQLFSANSASYHDFDIILATDWVVRKRMDVTNLSWGGLDPDGTLRFRDRWYDFQSRYNLSSFVAAAGNDGEFVHSPAQAWNVIAVGNINTGSDPVSWDDDLMNGDSSWKNPRNRNKKPNVAARGTIIRTLGIRSTGYIPVEDDQITGTSNAAPFVTATIALAMNRNATLLPAPEAAMATVMASAWNKVEYLEFPGGPVRPSQAGIHTSAASRLAGDFRTTYRYISPSSLNELGYVAIPVELRRNDRTRIAVAWSAAALSLVYNLAYLQSDFDVIVFEGGELTGRLAAVSVSDFNNVELVNFVPRITGVHTIAIYAPRLGAHEAERVGVAISRVREDVLGIADD